MFLHTSLIQKHFPPFIQDIQCTMPPLPLLHNFYSSPFRATALGISTAAGGTNTTATAKFIQFQLSIPLNFRGKALIAAAVSGDRSVNDNHPTIVMDSLRVLQWDQLCDCVASFAGTTLGKQTTKVSLSSSISFVLLSFRVIECRMIVFRSIIFVIFVCRVV